MKNIDKEKPKKKAKKSRLPKIEPVVSLTDTLEEFMLSDEESPEKILLSLLDKEDVEMKTQIEQPLRLAQLKTVSVACAQEKLKKCAKSIDTFIHHYLIYQVSKDRQSRKETIQALQALMTNERTTSEKLAEVPQKE